MSNLALRLAGPAVITFKGAIFASKGDIKLELANDTFEVMVDAYGKVDERSDKKVASLKFDPIGDWANLAVLFPAALQVIGGLTTPVKTFLSSTGVNTATDIITSVAHGFTSGAAVRVYSFDTIPTGLTAGTQYFLNVPSVDTFSLHTTRAAGVAGTGKVDITAVGSGTHRVIEQEPLVVTTAEGETYSFNVAALGGLPDLTLKTTETIFGEVTIDLFRTAGVAATTASSLFTLGSGTYTPPSIDPATILTQLYTFTWGSSPWTALETKAGIKIKSAVSFEDVIDDALGVIGKRVTGLAVTAMAQPLGVSPSAVQTALLMQGAGAGRGASLGTANDFVVSGTGVTVTLTRAGLKTAPHAFGRSADRIGDLEWFATRKFVSTVPQPLIAVA
jgi:hypothetical protein